MKYKFQIQKLNRILIFVLINIILIFEFNSVFVYATYVVDPTDEQYLELRAVSVKNVEGQNKQVIMELWGNNVEFKGFDVRFFYDNTKLKFSNIDTNEITDDQNLYFRFEDEFKSSLRMFTVPNTSEYSGVRQVYSFSPPVTTSEHIIEKEGIGKVVNTDGGVLLGKMSFQMTADLFDVSYFNLIEDLNSSPTTGIKINIDGTNYFDNKSTFRFTDKTASKEAGLSNLILSSGTNDELNPDTSTYKEYNLNPVFDKQTLNYELELLEYIDVMDITAVQEDPKSTMKIKIPKRDESGELVYESDGTTILYEEKEITNNVPFELTLNKLGELDTKITVIVTAEDGVTKNEYEVVIKRPYGTIRGTIITPYTVATTGKYISTIYAYKSSNVATLFDWDAKEEAFGGRAGVDTVNQELHSLKEEKNIITNDDGTFELKLIPGTYDILVDKPGYLDHIYIYVTLDNNEVIDLESYNLIAGDINKDAVVQVQDIGLVSMHNGDSNDVDGFEEKYDLNDDGYVQVRDIGIISADNGYIREIEDYRGR